MSEKQTTWRGAFTKTIEALAKQGLGDLVGSFEYELEVQQLRLDLRWFPVFLKMQNCFEKRIPMTKALLMTNTNDQILMTKYQSTTIEQTPMAKQRT